LSSAAFSANATPHLDGAPGDPQPALPGQRTAASGPEKAPINAI
jgi:hypothetical protein